MSLIKLQKKSKTNNSSNSTSIQVINFSFNLLWPFFSSKYAYKKKLILPIKIYGHLEMLKRHIYILHVSIVDVL